VGDADLAPAGLHLGEGDTALVAGPARSGKSTALCHLAGLVASRRPDVAVTAVTLRRSPLSAVNGVARVVTDPSLLVEAVEAVGAATGPQLVLVDDADAVEDQGGALAGLLQQRRPDVRLVAAGRADVLRSTYGHWTAAVRRSRHGIALRPHPELDGELWQTALPRRGPSWFPPGRGYLVTEGRAELVQVAGPGASGAELES
jgi:S-DNA-T family DNA segregation ATPase FtsK/SpoIIIE